MSEKLKQVGAAILEAESMWTPKSDEPKERAMARAAIEAMRGLTDEMEIALNYFGMLDGDDHQAWDETINAALGKSNVPASKA